MTEKGRRDLRSRQEIAKKGLGTRSLGRSLLQVNIRSVDEAIVIGAALSLSSSAFVLQGIALPTLNLQKPDHVFHGGFMPLSAPREMPIRAALSNSFRFGETNASLLFSGPP